MSIQLKKRILKSIMTLFPATPSETDFSLREIFHTDKYITGSKAYQDEVKLETAKWRYQYENQLAVPMIEKYFPEFDFKSLRGKVLLDVGCYTGGRSIFYKERYGMSKVIGIDIDKVFSEAAYLFTAKKKQTDVEFHVGFAENLPFADNIFDVIITTDVFEHVQDVQKCMLECKRVLKSTGVLLVAFPQYLQPLEAHLGLVTRVNFLHWFFSGESIAEAAYEICQERGDKARWYSPTSPKLSKWEKLMSLNGTSLKEFRNIISSQDWKVRFINKNPILSSGRRADLPVFKIVRLIFSIFTRLPYTEELFTDRVCYILEKK